jgi:hypothetical protein
VGSYCAEAASVARRMTSKSLTFNILRAWVYR